MIRRLRDLLAPSQRPTLDGSIVLTVVTAVLQGVCFVLLVPLLSAMLAGDTDRIWFWTLVLVAVAAGYAVAMWFSARLAQRVAIDLVSGLQQRLGDKVAQLPLGTVDLDLTGKLARLTSKGVMQVSTVPAHLVRPIIHAIGTPATVVIGMTFLDWRIGLAVLVCLPLLAVTYYITGRVVGGRDRAYADATASAAGRIVEFAQVQPALRAYGGTRAAHHELERALGRQHHTYRAVLVGGSLAMSGFVLAIQAVITVVTVVAVGLALGGSIELPTLIALLVLGLRFAEPLVSIADLGSGMRVSANSLTEITEILDAPVLPEPKDPEAAPLPADAGVELEGVGFGYVAGTPVLSDIGFTVAPGSTTALVGPSGSGKTTLTKLVARFHDVDSGTVRIGGVDVRELGTAHTMAAVSPVFQDVYLFSGSLLENIRMGRPEAGDAEVFAAARAAEVDEIAERLPKGWESEVGEGGNLLSGGERQRVSVARAILKDAPILLLDEATSALDPVNEQAVTRALAHLADKTRIVVAHRLDTVVTADQIVVLTADGRIAEIGDHESLLTRDGPYAAFWRTRTRAAGWVLAADRS